jgi:hypothetical protein
MVMRPLTTCAVLLLPALALGQAASPQRPPTFGAGIEVIRLNLSVNDGRNLPVAQEGGARFVRTLRPEDLGQVVQFNERSTVLQEFTADHSNLEAAIRSTSASGPTALYYAARR